MKTSTVKWLSGVNVLLGAWLIVAPLIYGVSAQAASATVIAGIVIAALAGYSFYRAMNDEPASRGAASLNVLAGIWVMAAPYFFEIGTATLTNNLVIGALVALLALANAWKGSQAVPRPAEA
jgi:hypothetical protein